MVHGSTFDMEGSAVNFPICGEACEARGFDYLAIGDWHGFKELPKGAVAPIVYPGSPVRVHCSRLESRDMKRKGA
jgi:DNA repair exonuclease SbcCD nuclease subunit